MIKKLTYLLAAILVFAAGCKAADEIYTPAKNEVVFSRTKIKIDALNPTPQTNKAGGNLPGARGAGQLVIYTPDYGSRTNTNEFGAEAVVENNIITELSGADSFIPQNGFVISGHGKAKTWINGTLSVGTKVFIDGKTLYSFTTSESYIFEASRKIAETEQMIDFYRNNLPNYNWKVPASYLNDAKDYLKKAEKNPEQVQKYSQLAIEAANDAIKSVVPYKNSEMRGVWIRPSEKTEQDVIKTIDAIEASGIDNVFLETYYHGKTIFPSKTMEAYGLVPQYEQFVPTDGTTFDPLQIWVSEAHKRKIKVHIWFETFYVGNTSPKNDPQHILAKNPAWGNKIKKDYMSGEITKSSSEHNGYFLDPANPFVQDFLMKLIDEIVTTYKPDGLNIDYIRYPNTLLIGGDSGNWGYTLFARQEFQKEFNVDPINIKTTDPLWAEWCNYRRDKVTEFVEKVGNYGKQKNVYTTAVIFPDRLSALSMKQQDWKTWSEKNYINGFTPLFLTSDSKTANSMMQTVINTKSPQTDFYAGLFVAFMNGAPEDLIRQIHEARKLNANGVIIFDYAHLAPKYTNALVTSVFSPKTAPKEPYTVNPEQPKKKWYQFFKKQG